MWIDAEPGTFPMTRYLLCFERGDPDPEDRWVRAYLREHRLEPKWEAPEERDGVHCTVLQFGQCYLGRHLDAIHALRTRGVVAGAVAVAVRGTPELAALAGEADDGRLAGLAWTVAATVLERDAAMSADGDPTRILVDAGVLREALLAISGPSVAECSGRTAHV